LVGKASPHTIEYGRGGEFVEFIPVKGQGESSP